ncbi:MAG: TraR/DksA C4-type zinc finger protein [Candidatus Methylomirabilota bacterium]
MKSRTEILPGELGARILAEQRAMRARLAALDREANASIPGLDADNTPLADPLEAASLEEAGVEREAGREALVRRLKQLYRAAEKVREGSYGRCDDCEEPIPLARLQAVPEAVRCRACAEETERLAARTLRRPRASIWAESPLAAAA